MAETPVPPPPRRAGIPRALDETAVYGSSSTGTPEGRSAFETGELVAGRYRIVALIAAGGMGEVYEAEDRELGERIALKTIRPSAANDPSAIERFKREIHLARRVTHPNVCRIFDFTAAVRDHDGQPVSFITMELLRGVTLTQHIAEHGRLSAREALPLVEQMCAALHAAHEAGIVHRDFKSDNVMLVAASGDTPRVVITDFGLARLTAFDEKSNSALTRPGEIVGTAAYLAPEQCQGSEVTRAADIYALGVVMYEMVTAQLPFESGSLFALVAKKLNEDASSPRLLAPDLETLWDRVILRCLERDPSKRFRTARDVVAALRGEIPVPASPARISRTAVLVSALLALAAVFAILQWRAASHVTPSSPAGSRAVAAARPSVAVLGFRNLSGTSDSAWMSTALAEMLSTELAAEGTIRTAPGENIQRMRNDLSLGDSGTYSRSTLASVRNYLGADYVVYGSYLVGGAKPQQLRIDVHLQDVTGQQPDVVFTESRAPEDLLGAVSAIGARLREGVGVAPSTVNAGAAALSGMTKNPEAARLYAEGLERLREFDALAARERLARSLAIDPAQPLAHAALAGAWSALGYDARARDEAKQAFDLSSNLPREQRLSIEAGFRETIGEWDRAIQIWGALLQFFPDNLEYGLRLAFAQSKRGAAKDALATVAMLHKLDPPLRDDPRIDLAEVDAHAVLTDYKSMLQAAEAAERKGNALGARLIIARALSGEGVALHRQGETERSAVAQERARQMFEQAGDKSGAGRSLIRLGAVHIYTGNYDQAAKEFTAGIALAERTGDLWVRSAASNNLAFVYFSTGEVEKALEALKITIGVGEELDDRKMLATGYDNVGFAHLLAGEIDDADSSFIKSNDLAKAIGNRQLEGVATSNLGDIALLRGDLESAKMAYNAALAAREKIGEKRAIAESRLTLARVALAEKQWGVAEQLSRDVAASAESAKMFDLASNALAVRANALLHTARLADAKSALDHASTFTQQRNNLLVQIPLSIERSRFLGASGDRGGASRLVEQTIETAKKHRLVGFELEARLARTEIERDPAAARALARDAATKGYALIARRAREM